MSGEGQKDVQGGKTTTAQQIQQMLSPHETWIMQIQSLLVWESPVRSIIFLLVFNFVFWLFALSSYHFFHVLGGCLLIVFLCHSWVTKIWPEIRVPVPAEGMNEEWTCVHPVLLNIPELSELIAGCLSNASYYYNLFWSLRRTSPGLFCLYVSSVFICGIGLGCFVPGRLLVYAPAVLVVLWPSVSHNNLMTRFYLKFEPFFTQLDNSVDIKRTYHRTRRPEPSVSRMQPDDSDTDLDEFVPGFKPIETDRLSVGFESGGSSLSSRNPSPFEPEFGRGASCRIAPPVFGPTDSPSNLDIDESNTSLLPTSIPSVDDVDSVSEHNPMNAAALEDVDNDFSDAESDENVEESLAMGLEVPDLQSVPLDDSTATNYLASVAGQTLSQMTMAGAMGFSRLASYIKGDSSSHSTIDLGEIYDDDDEDDHETPQNMNDETSQMTSSTTDFEFIEHEDVPALPKT